jgi:hypothetical protein
VRPDITEEELASGTNVLRRIFSNVLEHPLEDRYRCVNLQGRAWCDQVSSMFVGGHSVA